MKRIILVLLVVLMAGMAGKSFAQKTPAKTILRITDGIGWQYMCVSSNMANRYGFGGVGDTLTSDSTVSRGTLMNIKRCKESDDAGLSELLPIFVSTRTTLDSSYLYTKWSSVCWGLNNYYASIGGLSSYQQSKPDSGRFSPYFARMARANGIYLTAKSVWPPGNYGEQAADTNGFACMGYATLAVDSVWTYSDSAAIDSSLYGPSAIRTSTVRGFMVGITADTVGSCSLFIFGSNQNLIHGRKWALKMQVTGNADVLAAVAGDSIYNIDSTKIKYVTTRYRGKAKFVYSVERNDSL